MATIITPGGDSSSGKPAGPQLHVDSDWKAQAQAEKERLAASDAARVAKQAAASAPRGGVVDGAGEAGAGGAGEPTAPDFRSLVDMLAMQAVMYMGGMADKASGRAVFDPDYSRHMIDLLAVVEEKTRGNLAPDEEQDLKMVLNELRMRYVELLKLVAQQAMTGGGGAGGPGAAGAKGAKGIAAGGIGPGIAGVGAMV
jgi:hypothetical protein